MIERAINNGITSAASACAAASTTLLVADASVLPALSGGDQYRVTVYTPAAPSNAEILLVTGAAGNVLTVTRAAEAVGRVRAAFDHPAGDAVANTLTVGSLAALAAQAVVADRNYLFSQPTPAAAWVIAHGLGKYPSPVVLDSAGTEVVGDVTHDSVNQLTITFSSGFSGVASLN